LLGQSGQAEDEDWKRGAHAGVTNFQIVILTWGIWNTNGLHRPTLDLR
jgi:hypothetical protein